MSGTVLTGRRGIVLGPAVVLVAAIAVALVALAMHRPRAVVPYRDTAADGSIGLCDRAGQQITSGSTTAVPFVWRAVGTTPATGAYARAGASATLYAFQPRAGVTPEEWSGRMLTAAGTYSNPVHPMAAATNADVALGDFLAAYPPGENGYVQLRLYLSAPDQPTLTSTYDALDLQISGTTWHAVGNAKVDCTSGTSVSFETRVGLPGATP